jgi:hypothetical protein
MVTAPTSTSAPSTTAGQRTCRPRLRGALPMAVGVGRPPDDEGDVGASADVCLPTLGLSRRGDRSSPGDDRPPVLGSGASPGTSVCGE